MGEKNGGRSGGGRYTSAGNESRRSNGEGEGGGGLLGRYIYAHTDKSHGTRGQQSPSRIRQTHRHRDRHIGNKSARGAVLSASTTGGDAHTPVGARVRERMMRTSRLW
ncbi:hypothetical protein C2E23DRAFT_251131 [Lenzites betulinus]|nr:hypothetical protein C2E23DRAFT_251131 [Lenzites betulinus]